MFYQLFPQQIPYQMPGYFFGYFQDYHDRKDLQHNYLKSLWQSEQVDLLADCDYQLSHRWMRKMKAQVDRLCTEISFV